MPPDAMFSTRAEELGEALMKYFYKPKFYNQLIGNKAKLLVGGRGTGKTMLLKSLALKFKLYNKSQDEVAESVEHLINNDDFIGIYIRCDNNIVTSFRSRGIKENDWGQIYSHYFNLVCMTEIIKTLQLLSDEEVNANELYGILQPWFPSWDSAHITTLEEVLRVIKGSLSNVILFANNPGDIEKPLVSPRGVPIKELGDYISNNVSPFIGKTWYVCLDEYENLSHIQQRSINTLIKINEHPIIFKIGLKNAGLHTSETISETENLDIIADYDEINLEKDFTDTDYDHILREIYKTRLSELGFKGKWTNIGSFLPEITVEEEGLLLKNKGRPFAYPKQIEAYVKVSNFETEEVEANILGSLIDVDDPVKGRVHLILLDQGKKIEEIIENLQGRTDTYINWIHNYKNAAVYLLCHESRVGKLYAGMRVYRHLSSRIIRNFINLVNMALHESWHNRDNPLSVDNPREISFEEQSTAANMAANLILNNVDGFPVFGPDLYKFTVNLGRYFELLHKSRFQAEPEKIHFMITDSSDLSTETEKKLKSAILHSVLQYAEPTKLKSDFDVRKFEYVLNRVFAPYFQITYRKIKKEVFDPKDIEILMSDNKEDLKKLYGRIKFKDKSVISEFDSQISLSWR